MRTTYEKCGYPLRAKVGTHGAFRFITHFDNDVHSKT